jgi:hypothetical protein
MRKKLAVLLAATLALGSISFPAYAAEEADYDSVELEVVGEAYSEEEEGQYDEDIAVNEGEDDGFIDIAVDGEDDLAGEEFINIEVEEGFEEEAEVLGEVDNEDHDESGTPTVDPNIKHGQELFWDWEAFPADMIKVGAKDKDGNYYHLLDKDGNIALENTGDDISTWTDQDPAVTVWVSEVPVITKNPDSVFCVKGGKFMYPCQATDGTQYRYDSEGNIIGLQWHEDTFTVQHKKNQVHYDYEETDRSDPTCTEDGFVEYTWYEYQECENPWCECEFRGWPTDVTDAPFGLVYRRTLRHEGHLFNIREELEEPTCTEPGSYQYVCSKCGAVDENHIQYTRPLGHDWDCVDVELQTCIDDGFEKWVCDRCGEVWIATPNGAFDEDPNTHSVDPYLNRVDYLKADGISHDWDGPVQYFKRPTCTSKGSAVHYCKLCGDKEIYEVPPLGHTFDFEGEDWVDCYTTRDVYLCDRCGKDAWKDLLNQENSTRLLAVVKNGGEDYEEILENDGKDFICEEDFGIFEWEDAVPYYYVNHEFDNGHTHRIDDPDHEDYGEPELYKAPTCEEYGIMGWYCDHNEDQEDPVSASTDPFGFPERYQDMSLDELHDFGDDFFHLVLDPEGHIIYYREEGEETEDPYFRAYEPTAIHYEIVDPLYHNWSEWELRVAPGAGENEYGYWFRQCENLIDIMNTPFNENDDVLCRETDERIAEQRPEDDGHEHVWIDNEGDPSYEPATCTEEGWMPQFCELCGLDGGRIIPMADHTPVVVEGVPATCTEEGLTDGSKCEICGTVLTAQEVIPALGHTPEEVPAVDPTCTKTGWSEGSKCSVCGEILEAQQIIPALGHTPEVVEGVPATCTKPGFTTGIVCSVCGEVLSAQEEIPALGHKPVAIPAVAATCTETGLAEGKKCSVCGEILEAQQVIPALGHTPEVIPGVDPTITEPGLTEGSKCSVCGKILKEQEEIPKLKHGLVLEDDDEWHLYDHGVFQKDFTGLYDYNGGTFFIDEGIMCKNANGLNLFDGKWYYLAAGQVQKKYTGLVLYNKEWFYVKNGIYDTTFEGLVEYDGGLFLFSAGRLRKDVSGLYLEKDVWYYLAGGQVQIQYTGLAEYDGEWFYIKEGKLAVDYTGPVTYDGKVFWVVKGQVIIAA